MSAPRRLALLGVMACSLFLWGAAECTTSDPIALDDLAGNAGQLALVDVLANDTSPGGLRLSLSVTGGTCFSAGSVSVESDLVRFQPSPAVPSACTVTYRATDERGDFDTGTLTFAQLDLSIFSDDFESGTTGAWTSCVACAN